MNDIFRQLQREVDDALNPKGMRTNGPCYVRIPLSHAQMILRHRRVVVAAYEAGLAANRGCGQ
jgi:hypothetical protein